MSHAIVITIDNHPSSTVTPKTVTCVMTMPAPISAPAANASTVTFTPADTGRRSSTSPTMKTRRAPMRMGTSGSEWSSARMLSSPYRDATISVPAHVRATATPPRRGVRLACAW